MRDELALERTRLANERTFLAYVRTALSLLAAAAALFHFFPADRVFETSAWLLAAAGVLVLGVGLYRGMTVRAQLRARERGDD
ncbi:DUF202 domain-containing protein [Seongchinamella sediminis]|uniref:DUF202 domain-containing protein n=1 Tax=Seongchinamella sediminis TaxID=2283635 RepID=A0A3L7DXX5_9GAMM|nr:DUF202 domain-containing protein [Seongchinamella sediminis]RLQ20841.1 DUF202 domain-containing protein [Seongchinamella sediminis]